MKDHAAVRDDVSMDGALQPMIGLEVHAQIQTESKMFCSCSSNYVNATPDSHTCPVCTGMPGSLPVANGRAVLDTVKTALALGCGIALHSKFDRKNYSYPDLPKGYQITQYDRPLGNRGCLQFSSGGEIRRCGIVRVHLEEDTGKSTHTTDDGGDVTLVDYNRSGVPLMEIVGEPDLRSPEEARDYFVALRQVLMFLGVNDGNLQEGSLRADVNVSVRGPDGSPGTKVEVKNLNSFRAVQRALEYEIERQRRLIEAGEPVAQETRGWSETREVTLSQRSKEYAHDYRYFPEPDLPPLILTEENIDEVRNSLPELPLARIERLQRELGLSPYLARVLTAERPLVDFYEAVVAAGADGQAAANWVAGDVSRILNDEHRAVADIPFPPAALAHLLALVREGTISGTAAKTVLEEMFATGDEPEMIVERRGLRQIGDTASMEQMVDEVLAANPQLVATFRKGKTNVLQALVGRVMGASKGRANPALAREILERKLATDSE